MLIGEVSKEYGIGIETLRYYDRIGLLTIERRKTIDIILKKILKNYKTSWL